MGLVGEFSLFRKKDRLADPVLPQDNGAVTYLETADTLFSGNGERDRAVEFLFRLIMFLRQVIFHLHERAVHDPAEFDPLFRFFLFAVEDIDQEGFQNRHLKAEGVHRFLSPEVREFRAATAITDDRRRT